MGRQYADILLSARNFTLHPVGRAIAEKGAEIRAQYQQVRTPDAIQIATAVLGGAEGFLTNDRKLAQVRLIPVIVLDEFVGSAA